MIQRNLAAALIIILSFTSGPVLARVSAGQDAMDPVPLPVWREEIVAPGVGFYDLGAPALALDPAGNPHLVYGRNQLFHTWFDGAAWQNETIDASSAWRRESVLAIAPSGTITIADIHNEKLFARTKEPGGLWQTTRVPLPDGTVVSDLTLALDGSGEPHIAAGSAYYYYSQTFFIHAWHTPLGWSVEKVGTGKTVDGPFALDLDSKDRPFILYGQYNAQTEENEVALARRSGASWQVEKVAPGCVTVGKALVMDDQDKPHIVFSNHCDGKLTYMHKNDSGWETIPVTDIGYYPGLALDSTGRPHVVYGSDESQIYATLKGTNWDKTVVQEGTYTGWHNTLLLDKEGAAHIASYRDNLYYATNSSGQWQISTAARQDTVGRQNALALDSSAVPHTLYHEAEAQKLYWGSRNENGWATELVADVSAEGLEVAAVLDSQDRPTIAFLNRNQNNLLVGTNQAGEWLLEPIGAAGRQLSLAVGSDDRPQVLIIQNDALKYWTKQGEDWISETVSGSENQTWNASLALDSTERPHAIFSGSKGSFYAIRQSPGTWVAEALPFETVQGLALDADDQPHVLYSEIRYEYQGRYPIEIDMLWYAEREGQGWQTEQLWEEEYWNPTAELVVDAAKQVHVAFSTNYWGANYLLRDESGAWQWANQSLPSNADISLAVGLDYEPRLLLHDGSSLLLATREIIWLDKFSLMPVIGGRP